MSKDSLAKYHKNKERKKMTIWSRLRKKST